LRKQYSVAEERINNLTDSVARACASSIVKAQASLSKELVVRGIGTSCGQKQQHEQQQQSNSITAGTPAAAASARPLTLVSQPRTMQVGSELTGNMTSNSNQATGMGTSVSTAASSQPPVEGQLEKTIARLDELSGEVLAEKRRAANEAAFSADLNSVREMLGMLMSRISVLDSVMTRQQSSIANLAEQSQAQSQAQSQVPMTVQAKTTLASESHPAIALETSPMAVKATGTRLREKSDPGPSTQPSLHATLSGSISSVCPHKLSGIPAASKEMVRVQSRDACGMRMQNWTTGSVVLPASRQCGTPHLQYRTPKKATFYITARQSGLSRSRSEETLAPKLVSLKH